MKKLESLKERLKHWHDFDLAQYELAVVLGMAPEFVIEPEKDPWNGLKGIFWSHNPIGNALGSMIYNLVFIGVLEKNEDDKVRWNPNFKMEDGRGGRI